MASRSGAGLILALLVLVAAGCAKDENSPTMGAVAPKPNPAVVQNAPGGAPR